MDARGKFEEHERSVRVARCVAKCTHNSIYAQLKVMNQFFYNIVTTKYRNVIREKQVLFVIGYKILSMRCTEKQRFLSAVYTPQWYGLNEKVSSEIVDENLLL